MVAAKKRSRAKRIVLSSKKEQEDRAKYEEFWADPCWSEPLEVTEFSTKALQ